MLIMEIMNKSNLVNRLAILFAVVFLSIYAISKITAEDYTLTATESIELTALEKKSVSLQELYLMLLQDGKNFQLIDIRDSKAFEHDHLPNAIHIPFSKLLEQDTTVWHLTAEKKVIFYSDGETLSSNACYLLKSVGHTNIAYLQGGFTIAKQKVFDDYDPAYGHYSMDKPYFDFSRYFNTKSQNPQPQPNVVTEIKVSGGC